MDKYCEQAKKDFIKSIEEKFDRNIIRPRHLIDIDDFWRILRETEPEPCKDYYEGYLQGINDFASSIEAELLKTGNEKVLVIINMVKDMFIERGPEK